MKALKLVNYAVKCLYDGNVKSLAKCLELCDTSFHACAAS